MEDLEELMKRLLSQTLHNNGFAWPGHGPATPGPGPPTFGPPSLLDLCLQQSTAEASGRFGHRFGNLEAQVPVLLGQLDLTLGQVGNEIFRDGVNWGRIVAFFSFGGALCVESVRHGLSLSPGPIARMMAEFTHRNLGDWMQQHDGWNGFCEWWLNRQPYGIWNLPCTIL